MSLAPGTKLGPYEVVAPLGAGGMGEVYRARDTRLGREVALKVVGDAMSAEPDRLPRLAREAQLLASLNHPNIAALYGVEEAGGSLALVMELVEGRTLAERIAQGRLAPDEAIPIARQIAEALEYAHEHGIVHRDLKPANVKLLPDGGVKVLDFGLAKALAVEAAAGSALTSPTLTAAATRMGVIMGTAAYMSPEQAKGKAVDRRSDIWSFGCVLYEMLAGKLAFGGETVTDTLAAVVRGDPDWAALPPDLPAGMRKLLERCLRKDVKSRLQAVGDARIAIEEASLGAADALPGEAIRPPVMPQAAAWRSAVPWLGMALCALAALLLWHPWQATPTRPVLRLSADWGAEGHLYTSYGAAALLSPDGKRMAYVAEDAQHQRQLFIRMLDQLSAAPVPGTEGARDPFFSPDGQWLAFFAGNKLKKVAVVGGAVVTLCDIQDDRGGAWGEDGTIIFAPFTRTGLSRISAGGGTPTAFSTRAGNELTHRWPQFLPGGKVVIYNTSNDGNNYENADIVAQVVATGEKKQILHGGYGPHYVHGGFLVFIHEGTLFGVRFDAPRLALLGQPVPLLERVVANFGNAGAQVSFADSGIAAYISGHDSAEAFQVDWLASDGKITPLRKEVATYWAITLSPDGKSLALGMEQGGAQDIWVYDWQRNVAARLTFGGGSNAFPAWTPDGKRIAYASDDRGGGFSLWWKRADGGGDAQRLLESKYRFGPMAWRPDGKVLVFTQVGTGGDQDLLWVTLEGDDKSGWKAGAPQPFLNTPAFEVNPSFSPDGRWLAYESNESGAPEVYVRPFPGPGGRWQISQGGGFFPQWSRSGHEIFYTSAERRMMVASYSAAGDSFRADSPRLWSNVVIGDRGPMNVDFALHPDGKRIAILSDAGGDAQKQVSKVTFIVNFPDELRSKLAAAKQ